MTAKPASNALNWFEIPVTNLDKAAALYGAMLDLELEREVFMGGARAKAAGAKVIQPATSIGPIEDLDGNLVGLHAEARG